MHGQEGSTWPRVGSFMSASPREEFSTDCGLAGPLELDVATAGLPGWRCTFAQPWVVIGREQGATLPLDDAAVSRRHAYLQVLDGRLFAVDLGGRTGLAGDRAPAV